MNEDPATLRVCAILIHAIRVGRLAEAELAVGWIIEQFWPTRRSITDRVMKVQVLIGGKSRQERAVASVEEGVNLAKVKSKESGADTGTPTIRFLYIFWSVLKLTTK